MHLNRFISVFLSVLFFCSFNSFSQDTTWVQTFTFDSISTRRADFTFPSELKDKRFEKVLMYYKLKCSPLTTWDQFNCGEWDYLTYTRVFDHTGNYDSVRVDSVRYLHNYSSFSPFDYEPWGYSYKNSVEVLQHERIAETVTEHSLNQTSTTTASYPFDLNQRGGKYQMLVSASELILSGISVGDIQSLSLYVSNLTGGGQLLNPIIRIKGTSEASLTNLHLDGFTTVYDLNRDVTSNNELQLGENEFFFFQPFSWNGTDNIIVEFSFDHGVSASNQIEFETEDIQMDLALNSGKRNGVLSFDETNHALLEMSDIDMGDDITIGLWVKGGGNTGSNTSLLEAYDTLNQRVINIHMPWSNSRIYWDCGEGSGYDRIDADMSSAGIDNEWHHWTFVKSQSTGEMFIYRDGSLWHSGSDKTKSVGYLHRFVIGANKNLGNSWRGKIDDFQVFSAALDASTINEWYQKKMNSNHPNWADLKVAYSFDDISLAVDLSPNNYHLMPSSRGMFDFTENPLSGMDTDARRMRVAFGTGNVSSVANDAIRWKDEQIEPEVLFEFQTVDRHFEITDAFACAPRGAETKTDINGNIVSQLDYSTSASVTNEQITFFENPYEIIFDVEIARYITPYGIQFDLGPNGFSWIYDVTDYQDYLRDVVDLAAHNTQELLDLSFAFIEGVPPRDVHKREPIWSDFRSYGFTAMAEDNVLQEKKVFLSDTSSGFKIKTRMSGHGQVGNAACCEWVSNDHSIKVDGITRFEWDIYEEEDCGNNPLIGQGGTWPYAREGWCPGDKVKEYEFELTPFVTPGDSVVLDYVINNVPAIDPGQGGGNYRAAYDLISYSEPNFQNDAAIVEILNPSNYEYYRKWNPTCSNPRVVLRNTGAQPLTSCTIQCWITYGDNINFEWTGNLGFMEEEIVEIPVSSNAWWTDLDQNMTFTAYVRNVNGAFGNDDYQQNSVNTSKFEAPESIDGPFFVWFTTNNKANENYYELFDGSGNLIFERDQLQNNFQYKDTFDLEPGCYSIVLTDRDDDGLSFWYSSQVEGETAGAFRLRKVGGSYIEIFPGDFGSHHRFDFSVGFELGLDETAVLNEIKVFPNPVLNELTIEIEGKIDGSAHIEIQDLSGRILVSDAMNATNSFAEYITDVSDFRKGSYVVKIFTDNGTSTSKFVKY